MNEELGLDGLRGIKHIVVLMMENRSFDQMLGYLMRTQLPEVNGLTGEESNPGPDGLEHKVFEWGERETVFSLPEDPSGKVLDPDHSKKSVGEQLKDGNRGFVRNFVDTRPKPIPAEFNQLPMGYYGARHLPTYDFLAKHFCVCDAWHSSIPGDTWPNRQFALAGREGPKKLPSFYTRLKALFNHGLRHLEQAPIYDVPAFTRELAEGQWRWYSHDPATLRAVDSLYRNFRDLKKANFAYFDRQKVSLLTEALERPIVSPGSFLDDAANGRLRDVSWIDPNFIDLKVLESTSDDDHPPSDIRAGQSLVLEVYEALSASRHWDDTLLVVVYDEHGGFYDHVVPPPLDVNDGSGYATYGVRVPALVVGPRVEQQVCHEHFDHTSLLKTILLRFAADPQQAIARMGARVQHAAHLGLLLDERARADIPPPLEPRAQIDRWHVQTRAARRGSDEGGQSQAVDGAGRPFSLHDYQEEFARFALAMRASGLPPGEP